MKTNIKHGIFAASIATLAFAADKGGETGASTKEKKKDEKQEEKPAAPPEFFDVSQLRPSRKEMLPRKGLVRDAGTQPRVTLDTETISEYAQTLKDFRKENPEATLEGNEALGLMPPLPAITVFRSPTGKAIVADGFHRDAAHGEAKEKDIFCEIIEPAIPANTEDPDEYVTRLAVLYSCGVNEAHGLRRTQKDKRRAVQTLLSDPEWSQWSNNQIAKLARVSEFMVRDLRKTTNSPTTRKSVSKSGKVSVVKTGNIGKKGGATAKKKSGKTKGDDTPKGLDEETLKAVNKIVKNVSESDHGEKKANELKQALMAGTMENCPPREIRVWAGTSAQRILKAYPLVVEKRFKPSRAYDFIDRVPDGKTTLSDMVLIALTSGNKASEKFDDGGKKWKVTVEPA